jgi:hypothetical protein
LDDSIGDTFVSSARQEVSFALIDFQDWLDGEKPYSDFEHPGVYRLPN